jgi:ABC-2 type transport system permease protein
MLSLLRIEWLKLKNYRTFWVLSLLYPVSIFGINYIVYRIQQAVYSAEQAKTVAQMVIGSPPYSFPVVWQMTTYFSGFLLFLPGLLMIIFVTNEYSYKTHRQNIIDGWNRRQFITAKLSLAVIAAIISTVIVFITALIFGLSGETSFTFENIKYLGFFFIQALSYSLLAVLFAILFKRGGLAIGVFFLYSVVLENMFAGIINHYTDYYGRYLPLETTDNLISLPVFKAAQKQIIPPANITALLIVATLYVAAYIFFAIRKFERDDL